MYRYDNASETRFNLQKSILNLRDHLTESSLWNTQIRPAFYSTESHGKQNQKVIMCFQN